jgi:hypothetical protein
MPYRNRCTSVAGLLLVSLLAAAPARADTRDDIYVSLQRCNAIKENRTWLDCLYGAVQPMRAELGLPPAPPAQVRLVPQSGPVPPMPVAAARPTSAKPAPPEDDNFFDRLIDGKKTTETAPLRAYRFEGGGRFVVTLNNGEVWQQSEDDRRRARWKADAGSYFASIRFGPGGTGLLKMRGESIVYRVRKVE